MTVPSLRDECTELVADLARLNAFEGFILNGLPRSTEVAAISCIRTATLPELQEIKQKLDEQADKADAAARRRTAEEENAEFERTSHVMTDEEYAAVQENLERQRQIAEAANTTEARLGRVEGLLTEIRDLLKR